MPMSSRLDDEYKNLWERFLQTCKPVKRETTDGHEVILVNDDLAFDAISYIMRQLNDSSLLGNLNVVQYGQILSDAVVDFAILVYINHYEEGAPAIQRDPIYTSGVNLMKLMFSRTLNGKDRELEIESIKAKYAQNISIQR